ncbi:MAG: hypothetical protein M3461_15645 [Pseudomonadota bacterium]|nr:hypothetical protein [Pseudomonadota bacterium]
MGIRYGIAIIVRVPAVTVALYKRGVACAMVANRYRGHRNGRFAPTASITGAKIRATP